MKGNLLTRAQIVVWRHGWVVVAAPAALLVAIGLHFALLSPARAALQTTHAELARQSMAKSKPSDAVVPVSEKEHLVEIQKALGTESSPTELVRRMAALARDEQITLQQAEYQLEVHPTTGVTQVHVTQPVRANYVQLRRYIEAVLRTVPSASLDQVTAKRENVGQAQLEVRLRWSLWAVRKGT